MSAAAEGPAGQSEAGGYPSPLTAWAIVIALFVAYIFSFIDRMIIGLLVEPMKADLKITDTQISLLQGFAFAIFYTFAGLPIGRLIDQRARMPIIAIGVSLWSVMTAACGLTTQYWQLFLARMGVGVGEATLSPAAYSILADSFPPRRLGVAMGVYGLGSAVGAGLAFMIGAAVIKLVGTAGAVDLGPLGTFKAWQVTFVVVGLPGLLIAALFALLPEPPRHLSHAESARPSWADTFSFIGDNASAVLGLCLAVSMVNFAVLGVISWLPAMLIRSHGLSLTEAGQLAGGALILGGLIGTVGGGWISDRLQGGDPRARIRLCGWVAFLGVGTGIVFPLLGNPYLVCGVFMIFFVCAAVAIGAAPTALSQITPNRMRATVTALYLFFVNIIGLGVGPTATAFLGDTLFPQEGGIRYAMAIVAPFGFAVALVLFFVAASAAGKIKTGQVKPVGATSA